MVWKAEMAVEEAQLAELSALLAGAKALIDLDDAHGAKAQVLVAMDEVERLCGRLPEAEPADRRLAERLGALDHTAVTREAGEIIAETLRVGLRASMLSGDVAWALPFGRAALRFADALGLPTLAAQAHNDLASAYGYSDFHDRAIHHLRAGIGVLEGAGQSVFPALVNNLGNVYMITGRIEEAVACFERASTGAAEEGDELRRAIAVANMGRALSVLRRHAEAIVRLEEALALFRRLNRKGYVAAALAKLGSAHAAAGDFTSAARWFAEAVGEVEDESVAFRGEVFEALGRALLEAGRTADALVELERAERLHREQGAVGAAAPLLREQARALSLLGRHEEAYERLSRHIDESAAHQNERGEVLLGVLLVELEAGLMPDHELPAITGRALTEANRALRAQAERLERLSSTDELTQVYNRRYLNGRLQEAVASGAADGGRDVCLVLFDVDDFKSINDGYSHVVGDEVLRVAAQALAGSFRRTDVVARWGGEEFAVLLIGTSKDGAQAVADKARNAVSMVGWEDVAPGLAVTISAGVASLSEVKGPPDALELLKLADRRLYAAKGAGRNRVTAAD